jgi:hypothetical protein
VLHLIEMEMPESWGSMRLWVCLAMNEDTFPKASAEVIAGDFDEGKAWVLQHSRKQEAPSEILRRRVVLRTDVPSSPCEALRGGTRTQARMTRVHQSGGVVAR